MKMIVGDTLVLGQESMFLSSRFGQEMSSWGGM